MRASSTTPTGSAQRRAGSTARNGPWVRAQRASEPFEGTGDRRQECFRDAVGRRRADAVAVARGVLDRQPAFLAANAGRDGPSRRPQLREPACRNLASALYAGGGLARSEVAQLPEQVMELVERAGPAVLGQGLERQLQVGQGLAIEELPELLLAEQLAEEVAVEGQGTGAALGEGRVALVHVGRDVVEEERCGEWRGLGRLDGMDGDLPPLDGPEDLLQGIEVEDVGQALPVRLDEDREAPVARGNREKVGRALALLPERRPGAGPAARQQERPSRVLPKARGEERRATDVLDHQVLDLVGRREEERLDLGEPGDAAVAFALGQADGDAVVGPDGLGLDPQALPKAMLDSQRPRGVDSPTERGQDDQPPVAELVAEALDDDAPVRRQGARDLALLLEVGQQVLGGQLVEVVASP